MDIQDSLFIPLVVVRRKPQTYNYQLINLTISPYAQAIFRPANHRRSNQNSTRQVNHHQHQAHGTDGRTFATDWGAKSGVGRLVMYFGWNSI